MLIGLIFSVNLAAVGVAAFLQWREYRTAYIWLSFVLAWLLSWMLLALLSYVNIRPLIFENWLRIGSLPITLQFSFSNVNWSLAFFVITAVLSLFLTSVARLDFPKQVKLWPFISISGAFAFAGSVAGDLWTTLFLWTVLDLIDMYLHFVIFEVGDDRLFFQTIIIRFIGSLFLVHTASTLSGQGINPLFENIPNTAQAGLLLAAFLHSGALPKFGKNPDSNLSGRERPFASLYQLLVFLISFSLPLRSSGFQMDNILRAALSGILLALLFVVGWDQLRTLDDKRLARRNFFLDACFISLAILNDLVLAAVYIILGLLFQRLVLLIYSHRSRSTIIFPFLCVLLTYGLPFTLNTFGVRGLFSSGTQSASFVLLMPMIIFTAANMLRFTRKAEDFHQLESWFQAVYLVGLLLPSIGAGVIGFKSLDSIQNEMSYWYLGLIALFISFIVWFFIRRVRSTPSNRIRELPLGLLGQVLSMGWLFRAGEFLEKRLRRLVTAFSFLLEGAGGILWAFVILVLLLSGLR